LITNLLSEVKIKNIKDLGRIKTNELSGQNKETFTMFRALHYARNLLNREPSSYQELVKNNFMINGVEYQKMPKVGRFYHMLGLGGGDNIKVVSKDGRFEAVFNQEGKLLSYKNDPKNMGTYNYAPSTRPETAMFHTPCDVQTYKLLGNAEGGAGTMNTKDEITGIMNYSIQVLNPINWILHIVDVNKGREISIERFIEKPKQGVVA
jgi:hypothetical protein